MNMPDPFYTFNHTISCQQEQSVAFCSVCYKQKTFFHGHSYTGNPLACAAAMASLKIFAAERVIEKMQPKIRFVADKLQSFHQLPAVGDVRQCGLMVGIELVRDRRTKEPFSPEAKTGAMVCLAARKNGLILRPLGDVVVFMPPFCCGTEDLSAMLDILYRGIEETTS